MPRLMMDPGSSCTNCKHSYGECADVREPACLDCCHHHWGRGDGMPTGGTDNWTSYEFSCDGGCGRHGYDGRIAHEVARLTFCAECRDRILAGIESVRLDECGTQWYTGPDADGNPTRRYVVIEQIGGLQPAAEFYGALLAAEPHRQTREAE